MKKELLFVLILLMSVSFFGCSNETNNAQPKNEEPQHAEEINKKAVASLVEDFGSKLKEVSLQAPEDIVDKSMEENYGDLVSATLLTKWKSDPQNAPGRMFSSPWPERIEISSINKTEKDVYKVDGEIIEITSTEKVNGGVAAKRSITLMVKNIDNNWVVNDATLESYEGRKELKYINTEYGFEFSLPTNWENYSIVNDKWEGLAIGGSKSGKVIETGPMIYIRHPKWTAQNPRQDIPIMIFTLAQWDSLQQEDFHIGAAPIRPSELGRNAKYVFALPARYNYAFPTGYKEVENILRSNPLHGIENYHQ